MLFFLSTGLLHAMNNQNDNEIPDPMQDNIQQGEPFLAMDAALGQAFLRHDPHFEQMAFDRLRARMLERNIDQAVVEELLALMQRYAMPPEDALTFFEEMDRDGIGPQEAGDLFLNEIRQDVAAIEAEQNRAMAHGHIEQPIIENRIQEQWPVAQEGGAGLPAWIQDAHPADAPAGAGMPEEIEIQNLLD